MITFCSNVKSNVVWFLSSFFFEMRAPVVLVVKHGLKQSDSIVPSTRSPQSPVVFDTISVTSSKVFVAQNGISLKRKKIQKFKPWIKDVLEKSTWFVSSSSIAHVPCAIIQGYSRVSLSNITLFFVLTEKIYTYSY